MPDHSDAPDRSMTYEDLCTGQRYLVNPDHPDEGFDIHHESPCPAHPATDEPGDLADAVDL